MAVSDYLLEFQPKLKGESQDHQYKDAVEIDSWSWSGHNASTHMHGSGGGAGKVSLGDFQLSKSIVDTATVTLFLNLCTGKHFDKAILHCRKKTGDDGKALEYLTIEMNKVTVSSVSLGGHGSATGVSESVSLAFEEIKLKYTQQNADGTKGSSVGEGWNLAQNKKVAA
jgi:type VI secretion system secreted protein Hcp